MNETHVNSIFNNQLISEFARLIIEMRNAWQIKLQ